MKRITLITVLALLFFGSSFGQKFSTKTGEITFEASVPSFEEVKAKHTDVGAILNTETGDFASLALIKGFRFKVALMEEHFNENYMESSEYPKAVFKGKLQDFSADDISEGSKEYKLKGSITMHGTSQDFETQVRLKKDGDEMKLETSFVLKPGDFNIEIPSVVSSKIADEVTVTAIYTLKEK